MGKRVPSYRLHKSTGQAVVSFRRVDYYLGEYGSPQSKEKYARLVAEWSASGRVADRSPGLTVAELFAAYWAFAQGYYVKRGRQTKQVDRVRRALGPARELYGRTAAAEFGPVALKAVRQRYVEMGWCRKVCNSHTACVVRAFRWGVGEEMVPAATWQALAAVEYLKEGRTPAPDHADVEPVPEADIEAALPHMPSPVAAMVRFQLLTGCRPGEACLVRGDGFDRSGDVWLYRPYTFKMEHESDESILFVGPKCRAVIAPFLERHGNGYLFSPRDSMAEFRSRQRAARKSKVQPSQLNRSRANPRKGAGEHYTTDSYGQAIARACAAAGVRRWGPHRLRHNAATRLVEQFGWNTARVILNHKDLNSTKIYAANDMEAAIRAIARFG